MSAIGGIHAALKTLIATDGATAALIANAPFPAAGVSGKAVYDDGSAPQPTQVTPMSALAPWVTVGAWTEVPFGVLGSRAWDCTGQVKVTAQGTEAQGQAIVAALSALLFSLPPTYLTVAGFASCCIVEFQVQPVLLETLAGVLTRSWPVIVRVYAT